MDLKNIVGVLSELSWQKLLQVFVFCALSISFIMLWMFRESLYQSLNKKLIPSNTFTEIVITSKSSREIAVITKKLSQAGVIGIEIIAVDFRKNLSTRKSFFSISDRLQRSADEFLASRDGLGLPVFSYNEQENKKIIDLLNGQFVCVEYSLTPMSVSYQGTSDLVEYVCSVPIPPFYGKFAGYINFYVSRKPVDFSVESIRQAGNDLSILIYEETLSERTDQIR